jgi:hypothetical protein
MLRIANDSKLKSQTIQGLQGLGLLLEEALEFLGKSWNNFVDVADYSVCGYFKDRRIGIFVDSEDDF